MSMHRSLRKGVGVERLRVDIADFDPAHLSGMRGGFTPWVATGKHLCGAATDFTLRCAARRCAPEPPQPSRPLSAEGNSAAGGRDSSAMTSPGAAEYSAPVVFPAASAAAAMSPGAADRSVPVVQPSPVEVTGPGAAGHGLPVVQPPAAVVAGRRGSGEGSEGAAREGEGGGASGSEARSGVQGIAVATCCHHRCSWRHYVGKALFRELGFQPEEFELVSWMTGMTRIWAAIRVWEVMGFVLKVGLKGKYVSGPDN